MIDKVILYHDCDEFCKTFEPLQKDKWLGDGKMHRERGSSLSLSEIMTIIVLFQTSGFRNFKSYYTGYVCELMRRDFPRLVSYNRFVELERDAALPLGAFLTARFGACTGISFVDSTSIKVCHNLRIHSHKVFKGIAKRGKTSTGWFYGFKVHLVVSEQGELLGVIFTTGNIDDRKPVSGLARRLFGKLFGDRGYISEELFNQLWPKVQLITKIKKKMHNRLQVMADKILLRKRAIIETIIDQLKNICVLEHTRHRSVINFTVNLLAALIAYTYQEKKPSLDLSIEQTISLPLVTF